MEVARMVVTPKSMGQPIRRREDPRLITGTSTYVDDLQLSGTLYLALLRSPHGHARVKALNVERARSRPDVLDVITRDDLPGALSGPMPLEVDMRMFQQANTPERWPLAGDKVRFVGEPVAALVATDRYAAKDALEDIEIEYEPLPVVTDPERALAEGAPLLYEELRTNLATRGEQKGGELDAAFGEADRT